MFGLIDHCSKPLCRSDTSHAMAMTLSPNSRAAACATSSFRSAMATRAPSLTSDADASEPDPLGATRHDRGLSIKIHHHSPCRQQTSAGIASFTPWSPSVISRGLFGRHIAGCNIAANKGRVAFSRWTETATTGQIEQQAARRRHLLPALAAQHRAIIQFDGPGLPFMPPARPRAGLSTRSNIALK